MRPSQGMLLVLLLPTLGAARTITLDGVTFEAPAGLTEQTHDDTHPHTRLWSDPGSSLRMELTATPLTGDELPSMPDLPGLDDSFATLRGQQLLESMAGQFKVNCSMKSVPGRRDPFLDAFEYTFNITCPIAEGPLFFRLHLIHLQTRTHELVLQVHSSEEERNQADAIVNRLWSTLRVEPSERVVSQVIALPTAPHVPLQRSPAYGPHLRFTPLGPLDTTEQAGRLLGRFLAALFFGWGLTYWLLRFGVTPLFAVFTAQLTLLALIALATSHELYFEVNVGSLAVAAVAALLLSGWARRKRDELDAQPGT